jgi:prepilin-type N-terminal cleavage/methylation domain-containing protein/prepilin-type processing-associated H-X9-DG protein
MDRAGRPSLADCKAESSRAGFTLVELLVVIAIIGILVALLLPAIQSAREAARRTSCQSNMKNIALALQNYHSANNRFPVGFVSQPAAEEAWAWTTFTLPYLEEQALYDKLNPRSRRLADLFIAANTDPSQLTLVQTPLAVFRCASDTTPALCPVDGTMKAKRTYDNGQFERHFNGNNAPKGFQPSASNYIGNKGFANNNCPQPSAPDHDNCLSTGIFFGDSKVSMKQITDGTSHTFLLGERDRYCLSSTWIGVRNPVGEDMNGSAWLIGRQTLKLNDPITGDHETCTEGFSSKHSGGAFFAFCDGSVQFVGDDIDYHHALNNVKCYVKKLPQCKSENSGFKIGVYQRLGWRDDDLTVEGY